MVTPHFPSRTAANSLLLILALGVLTACSSGAAELSTPPSESAAVAEPTPTTSPTPTPEPVPLSAAEAAALLVEGDANVTQLVEVTEDNDPNDLIGRPNGYTEAVVIYDSRVACDSLGSDCGATLEVWPTSDAAAQRSTYILDILSGSPALGSEYHTVRDNYLLRVTGDIVPSEANVIAERFESIELTRAP